MGKSGNRGSWLKLNGGKLESNNQPDGFIIVCTRMNHSSWCSEDRSGQILLQVEFQSEEANLKLKLLIKFYSFNKHLFKIMQVVVYWIFKI
jgi:hypothetical protein